MVLVLFCFLEQILNVLWSCSQGSIVCDSENLHRTCSIMVFTAKWIRHPEDKQFYIIWLSVPSSSILIWTESRPLPIPGEAFDGSFVLTLHLELFWSSQHRPTAVTNAQQNYQHLPHTSNMAFLLRGMAYMSERQRQHYYRTVFKEM